MYHCVDLSMHFNSKGIARFEEREYGTLDPFLGLSFPQELLNNQEYISINDIPFMIGLNLPYDNIELLDQQVSLSACRYTDIYFIGASNNGNFYNEISIYNETLSEDKKIYIPDLFEDNPSNGEIPAIEAPYMYSKKGIEKSFKPKLWIYHLPLKSPTFINSIKFSENPFIHIFSITLKEHTSDG